MKNIFENICILTALGLSAAAALVYEVVATHMLLFYFIESSYSIATVLSVFLLGLGVGSLTIYFLLPRIKNKNLLFGILQIGISLYAFFVLTNLREIIPPLENYGTFFTSLVILFIPTFFLGAVFPLSSSIFIKYEKKEIVGLVYSSDLFGAIAGSLIAGFILIPNFGGRYAIIFGAILNLISAFIIFSKNYKLLPLLLLVVLSISSFNFESITVDYPQIIDNDISKYQYYSHSPFGLITVKNNCLYIDERIQCCGGWSENRTERMMANYALDPLDDKRYLSVLNIGLGCGLTLERCLEFNTSVDVVEINEKVVEANKVMTDVLKNIRVCLIIDDGLHYLRVNEKKYDSILIDVENPLVAHSSNLYTVDAFVIINQSLSNNGTFALWNYGGGFGGGYEVNSRYHDVLYYSLKEAFPYVYEYTGVFLMTKQKLDREEYVPTTPYEINTIDRNTITDIFLGQE
jgi:spermidine synthase